MQFVVVFLSLETQYLWLLLTLHQPIQANMYIEKYLLSVK